MRLHINLAVENIENSVRFYSALFSIEPSVLKEDYAKWMLDDPHVNFAISTRRAAKGLDHFGVQVESEAELHTVYDRLKTAELPFSEEGQTACCYARSDKAWSFDPDGNAWETFLTLGEHPVYGNEAQLESRRENIAGKQGV